MAHFWFFTRPSSVSQNGDLSVCQCSYSFALGFSSNNIMSNLNGGNVENFMWKVVKAVAVLNPSDQIESDCDISEIFIDEFIMHHERLSGSSDLC